MAGSSSMVAVADDLTGAAEIAALAHAHALRTSLVSARGQTVVDASFTVFDSDSRLVPPADAAARLTQMGEALRKAEPAFLYKKTDSVLRGNVVAETVALAAALGRKRILLVPANPSLGRTIVHGRYFVGGKPIDQTSFAHDPHHPAKTSEVTLLLGGSPSWPVTVASLTEPLPSEGIIVGEVSSHEDVLSWAQRLPADALPAGGAEFFVACLESRGLRPVHETLPKVTAPALILSGSLTPAREAMLAQARVMGWPHVSMPRELVRADTPAIVFTRWKEELRNALASSGIAVTESPRSDLHDPAAAAAIRNAFAQLVHGLRESGSLAHLVVEGGATAAAIAEAAAWTRYEVVGTWAQGVISLRALPTADNPIFTIKPGSYAWPAPLWKQLSTRHTVSSDPTCSDS